jgi:PBP1b-binding outer membrane lipoprotein LpoB
MSIYFITRITLVTFAIVLLAGCSAPVEPKAEIVGTWEVIHIKSVQQTYSKDGTYHMVVTPGGPAETGTWSIDSNRLTVTFPDIKKQTTVTILKLDHSVLTYEATNESGKLITSKWSRIK